MRIRVLIESLLERKIPLIVVFLCILSVLFGSSYYILSQKSVGFDALKKSDVDNSSCLGIADQYYFEYQGFIHLNNQFIPSDSSGNAFYKQAIKDQIKYLAVQLPEINSNLPLRWSGLTYDEPEIKIISVKAITYPHNLEIDTPKLFNLPKNLGFYTQQACE